MKGFKQFLMRGNLIELAVAFIMGGAFAAVVTKFTKILMDIIGKFGGQPNFDKLNIVGINYGEFLTALVSFVILAFVIYFCVVKPSEAFKKEDPEAEPETNDYLKEIRDLLAEKKA
ncbi:MAG: large conductance mechanosensitive channel protein MscL [Propionibacteriaceae bacterium]